MEKSGDFVGDILNEIGTHGRFQKTFNFLFNFLLTVIGTMTMYNSIIGLAIPKHWCKVPSQELTNFTMDQWRNFNIPRSNKTGDLSHCSMYISTNSSEIQECYYGYEYDSTYYEMTIVSQEDWVCDSEIRVTQLLMFGKVGEIIGTAIFAQLGDSFGRKPVVYLSILALIVGKLGLLISKGSFYLFVFFIILGNLSALAINQAPVVIAMEISGVDERSIGTFYQVVGFTLGHCLLAAIFWATAHWMPMIVLTTVPLLPFLFLQRYLVESPRWLASKGKTKKCAKVLRKIAKRNGNELIDKNLLQCTEGKIDEPSQESYGIAGLFTSWKIIKLTALVLVGWSCVVNIYIILLYNVTNLSGNPFVNYFWQALAELPGNLIAHYLNDKIGRKFTRLGCFITLTVLSACLAYILNVGGNGLIILFCGIILRFVAAILYYTIYLHTMEIYPTCLRQTGASVGYIGASVFSIFIPYILQMGNSMSATYPYIFAAGLAVIGAIFGMFLPETLNENPPDSIKEAEEFGVHQSMWSMPRRKSQTPVPTKIVTQ